MIPRRIARPMLAAWFVTEGSAAVRGSATHLEPARAGVDALAAQVGFARPTDPQLRTIVQVHGGLTIAAGAALALGKAPRLAALLLALLTFPSVVAGLLASRSGTMSAEGKAEQQQRALRAVSFTGAALIAAGDREGRPGLAWKMSHAKQLAAAGAASGVSGLAKTGAKAAGTATKASKETGAKAVKHAKKTEAAAVVLSGKAAAKAAEQAAKVAARQHAAAVKAAEREHAHAVKVAEAEAAQAVTLAEAEAARAVKAAAVAERAEAKASRTSRRTRRAKVGAAEHAVDDVIVVA